jgi:hypothetical protein
MEKNINQNDYMENSHGSLVPKAHIHAIDLLRDQTVMNIVKQTEEINKILRFFKMQTMRDIDAFVQLSAEKYKVKWGGKRGNITLLSFNGEYKVIRSINDYIVFDERLQIAKEQIDNCAKKWSDGSRSEIKALINYAFQVDKTGKISTERILGLRRLDIKDPDWLKAMELISDSIQVTGSKEYVRIYKRNKEGKYDQIDLDFAAL